ncbi:MAG: hypothetical protein V1644_03030 [Candidatus Micrarchaeota archaeon]
MKIPSFIQLSSQEKIVLVIIAIFVLIFFKPVVAGDGVGYYVVLEGAVRDHTFNLTNQVHYNSVFNGTSIFFYDGSKQFVSQYAPGMALLSAPFYAASLFLDNFQIFHIKDEFFLRERGDILIHQFAAILAPLLLLAIALLFSLEICKKLNLKTGALALLLTFFGTPIIRYATYDLFYTHVVEAGLLALLLYCFFTKKPTMYAGALIGLLTLVRYTSALYLIPFALYLWWKQEKREISNLAIGFAPFLLAILAYFSLVYGSPFTSGYTANGALSGNFDLIPFGFFTAMFSTQSGLLLWSPLALLALFGLWKWNDDRKWLLLGLFATMLWHTSAFFGGTTGYSFSNRYYAAMFPILVIGLAVFLEKYKKFTPLVLVFSIYSLVLFLLALAGDFTGAFPTLEGIYNFWLRDGNLTNAPQLIFEKTGLMRLLFEK